MKSFDKLTSILVIILLVVFGLVVFHAPISVILGQILPDFIAKAWKEILLILALPIALFCSWRSGIINELAKDWLFRLIGIYIALHLLILPFFDTTTEQKLIGVLVDLRYIIFFVLIFIAIRLQPKARKTFLRVGIFSATASLTFATLQATILPKDILSYIGYSQQTIQPYLTVDKNNDFIRINGTLRGPNPLGAYALICISLIAAFALRSASTLRYKWQTICLAVLAVVSIWASYSRSAFIGLIVSIGLLFSISFSHKPKAQYLAALLIVPAIALGGIFLARDSDFIQNVVLHNNPDGGSKIDSNDGHVESVQDGVQRTILQPYGAGIGSTGSASLRGENPLIIENQYLLIAHESGWFGLALFISIFMAILGRLYKYKRDWLSLGVFASGIGLACIGLFLPVWIDDTVSLVWFGLAAIALGSHVKKGKPHGQSTN